MPRSLDQHSLQLVLFLREQRDLIPDGRYTWDRGGCWTLAEGIRLWLGDSCELWALADAKGAPHHVVAKAGDLFLDVRGPQSEARLRDTWAKHHPAEPLYLVPFSPSQAEANDLYLEPRSARTLARRLAKVIPRSQVLLEPVLPMPTL